jgi:hypothetical protein
MQSRNITKRRDGSSPRPDLPPVTVPLSQPRRLKYLQIPELLTSCASLLVHSPMDYVDKILTCLQCGDSFTFSASEQATFTRKGRKKEPRRCPDCREARIQWRRGSQFDALIQALLQSSE